MDHTNDIHSKLQETFAFFEAEPSRDLWPSIAAEIQPRRRRVVYWPYLAVAASVAILIASWVLLQPGPASPVEPVRPSLSQHMGPLPQENPAPGPAQLPAETARPDRTQSPRSPIAPVPAPEPTPAPAPALSGNSLPSSPRRQLAVLVPRVDLPAPTLSPRTPTPPPPAPATASVKPRPIPSYQETYGSRNTLNLNDIHPEDLVTFASRELSKWAKSPIEVTHEERPNREIRTYQLDILNLTITRKTHRTTK